MKSKRIVGEKYFGSPNWPNPFGEVVPIYFFRKSVSGYNLYVENKPDPDVDYTNGQYWDSERMKALGELIHVHNSELKYIHHTAKESAEHQIRILQEEIKELEAKVEHLTENYL
jgi:coenzyme F420-reducing hydrogenase delta subunit